MCPNLTASWFLSFSRVTSEFCFPEPSPTASGDLLCPNEVKQLLLHTGLGWYPLYHQNLGTILDISPRSSLFFPPTAVNWLMIPRYKALSKYSYPNFIGFKRVLLLFMSISVLFLLLSQEKITFSIEVILTLVTMAFEIRFRFLRIHIKYTYFQVNT